ncbi:MAG: DUF58 domain-containing protein [Candidatus Hodarchaeales archaeon]
MHKLEITPQGQVILVLASVGGLLGMNFGLTFLWLPSFALILYFLPFLRYHFTTCNFSAFRVFSSSTITLGGFLHCKLRIKNLSNNSLTLTFENSYSSEIFLVKGWTHQTVRLNRGESRNFSFIFTFSRRGLHEFFPLNIYRGDPLGLYRDSYEVEESFQIRVIPARPYIRLDKQQKKRVRDILTGYHSYRRRGQGDEFFSLREYIRGDEPRKIYWKGSAKQGKLISKEFTDQLVFRLLVAVDISWTMRSRKLEFALTTLLELAEMSAITNDAFGFILFDERAKKFLKPKKSPRLYEKTARLTFDQLASNSRARFEAILPFIFSLKGTRGLLVIISDAEGILNEKIKAVTKLAKFGHRIIFVDLRGDHFGIAHANLSIKHLNTIQKLKYLGIVRERIARKYSTREQKLRETLDQVGGTYLKVDSPYQNLLIMLRQEFDQDEHIFPQWMVNL